MSKLIWISKNCLLSCVIADVCLLCLYHVDVAHNSQIGQEMKHAHKEKARNFSLKGLSIKVQTSVALNNVVSFD